MKNKMKNKMNLKWIVPMLSLGISSVVCAQEQMGVKIEGKETQRIPVENLRKLTFPEKKMNIITVDDEEVLDVPLVDIVLVFNAKGNSTTEITNVGSLQIYQSDNFLYIKSEQSLGTITITDLQGRKRLKTKGTENETSINVSSFERGVYILQVNKTALKFILK